MRDLVVRFMDSDGTDYISEMSESSRNYFFWEANQIIEVIRGKYPSFTKEIEFEFPKLKQTYNVMIELNKDFDLKQTLLKTVNQKIDKETLSNVFYEENKAFENEAFCVFVERYDYKLCQPKYGAFPYLLSVNQMYGLFESAWEVYEHLFFSNLENVINAVEGLFKFIVSLPRSKKSLSLLEVEKFFYSFVNEDSNYRKMKQYIYASLTTLSINSIDALYPKYEGYQTFEKLLFSRLPAYIGHQKCMEIHEKVIESYYLRFHIELFEGRVLSQNKDFEMYVFNPVMLEMYKLLDNEVTRHVQATNVDKEMMMRDINSV